jgi:hypothetical protein
LVTRKQDELLYALVRAARCLDLPEPVEFHLTDTASGKAESRITHPCLPGGQVSAARSDVEALIRKGLLRQSDTTGDSMAFDIDPRGFEVFRQKARAEHRPVPRMGISARAHMDGSSFEQAYPIAYDKWAQAEALLPADDPTPTGQSVYQLCNEALLTFAGYLEAKFGVDDPKRMDAPAHERIRTLLESKEMGVETADRHFLTALLSNWRSLVGRVQNQGETAPSEDGALHWQDLHLAVFHTAVVMFEIDRSLARSR